MNTFWHLITVTAVCLLMACGGGGGGSQGGFAGSTLPEPYQGSDVQDTTIKGESHAAFFKCDYITPVIGGTCENDGVPAAPIEWTLKFPDNRVLRRVILFTGGNTLETESVDYAVEKYALLFWGINSANTYCIGLPPHYQRIQGGKQSILDFNQAIKGLCGEDHYIDAISLVGDDSGEWKPGMTNDDIHLTEEAYLLIIDEIAKREAI